VTTDVTILAGSALLVFVLGLLIRFGRVTVLIAGVGPGDSPDPRFVDVVGSYTILVGLATAAMTALTRTGGASDRLWTAYAVAVVASAVAMVAWANAGTRGVGG
jgi:hypothetical protein